MQEDNTNKIDISLSEDVAQGTYSNLAIITHSNTEFIVDFVAMMPGMPKANVRSRIIMTPQNTKRLLNALAENVHRYEEKNGTIQDAAIEIPIMANGGAMA
ncbi:MAG: DUF3467 domain-containing protein [Bacteroidales bacterium]|jgi:hypothetical protein|nr:DUF3467 domain-containing protein [Bacteroidales bacterium]